MKKRTEDGHAAEQALVWADHLRDDGWLVHFRLERAGSPGMLVVYAVAECSLPNGEPLVYRREWERVSSIKPGGVEGAMLRAVVRLSQGLDGTDPRDAAKLVSWNRAAQLFKG